MTNLLLACGCAVRFVDGKPPTCASHGPQRVVRTLGMPKPRFVGVASGPHVTKADLPPWTGKIVESDTHG